MFKATVLCENSVFFSRYLIAEHGWSVYVQTPEGTFLWDTGQGLGLRNNAQVLGADLHAIDAVLLSHSHFDHTAGLEQVLMLHRQLPVYLHADSFVPSYSARTGQHIGIPFTREHLEAMGAQLHFNRTVQRVTPHLWLTGSIPRQVDFETGGNWPVLHEGEQTKPYRIPDDQTLVWEDEQGLCVLLGCAHAGVINILTHILNHSERKEIALLMGGTHLERAPRAQQDATISALAQMQIGRIGVSHCTGEDVAQRMQEAFGDRFFRCHVGTVVTL